MKIFSFLYFDKGFNKTNFNNYIFTNCNSGMKRKFDDNYNKKSRYYD